MFRWSIKAFIHWVLCPNNVTSVNVDICLFVSVCVYLCTCVFNNITLYSFLWSCQWTKPKHFTYSALVYSWINTCVQNAFKNRAPGPSAPTKYRFKRVNWWNIGNGRPINIFSKKKSIAKERERERGCRGTIIDTSLSSSINTGNVIASLLNPSMCTIFWISLWVGRNRICHGGSDAYSSNRGFGFDNGCVMPSRFVCEGTGVKRGLRNGLFMLNCYYRTSHVREAWWLSRRKAVPIERVQIPA